MYSKKCKICNEEFTSSKKFNNHLKRHNVFSIKEYIILFELNGTVPKCVCGYCNEDGAFIDGEFKKYAVGHSTFKWKQQKYIEIHGMPLCKTCGNPVKFKRGIPNTYCSLKCLPNRWNQEKINITVKSKYGVDNVFQLNETKLKSKQTKKERYNDENYFNKEKCKQTSLYHFGVEHPTQAPEIKEKIKQTCLKNWNVEYSLQNKEIREKGEETCKTLYGVESPQQNKEIHEKTQKTALKLKCFKNTNIWYQGSYEFDFLEKFYNKYSDITRGPSIKYKYDGKNKIYHSDFLIPSLNLIVECKSLYLYNRDYKCIIAKKDAVEKSGKKYILILDKDYSEFLTII